MVMLVWLAKRGIFCIFIFLCNTKLEFRFSMLFSNYFSDLTFC
jgi:hypothetical protein